MNLQEMKEKQALIEKIRLVFESAKRFKSYTQRILTVFKTQMPDHHFYFKNNHSWGQVGLEVWGQGVSYNNRVIIDWNEDKISVWQEGFLQGLERVSLSDSIERAEQEQELIPELERLENEAARIRNRAAELVRGLRVPESATLRNEAVYWERPSYELRKKFPLLFND